MEVLSKHPELSEMMLDADVEVCANCAKLGVFKKAIFLGHFICVLFN